MQFVRTNCLAVWRLFEQNPKCICSNKLQNALCSLFEQTPKLIMQFVRTTSKIHYAVCSNKLQNSLCSSLSVSLQYLNISLINVVRFLHLCITGPKSSKRQLNVWLTTKKMSTTALRDNATRQNMKKNRTRRKMPKRRNRKKKKRSF